jgi:DNA-binding transcriptional regulator YiaG
MTAATLPAVPFPRERLRTSRDPVSDAAELRRMRENVFDVSQSEMAHVLDVSTATYYRWESGKVEVPFMALELMRAWAREEAAKRKKSRKK